MEKDNKFTHLKLIGFHDGHTDALFRALANSNSKINTLILQCVYRCDFDHTFQNELYKFIQVNPFRLDILHLINVDLKLSIWKGGCALKKIVIEYLNRNYEPCNPTPCQRCDIIIQCLSIFESVIILDHVYSTMCHDDVFSAVKTTKKTGTMFFIMPPGITTKILDSIKSNRCIHTFGFDSPCFYDNNSNAQHLANSTENIKNLIFPTGRVTNMTFFKCFFNSLSKKHKLEILDISSVHDIDIYDLFEFLIEKIDTGISHISTIFLHKDIKVPEKYNTQLHDILVKKKIINEYSQYNHFINGCYVF